VSERRSFRLVGEGPIADAVASLWARTQAVGALTWQVASRDPQRPESREEFRRLQRALLRVGAWRSATLGASRWTLHDGRQLDFERDPGTPHPSGTPSAACIETGGPRVLVSLADGRSKRVPRPAVLAALPLLRALEAGPGLRWVNLDVVERSRVPESEPPPERVPALVSDPALCSVLTRKLTALAGRLQVTRHIDGVGSDRGATGGDSIRLCALLDSRGSLEGTGDALAQLADTRHDGLRFELAPAAIPHDALGRASVLIDPGATRGVGPLVQLLAHYDPVAVAAAAAWHRASS